MYTSLLTHLSVIHPLSPELVERLSTILVRETLPKKTLLLKQGQVGDKMYFVEQGLVRAYYLKGTQEVTAWFMAENDVIVSVYSFFARQPSYENIELLEDATLVSIRYADLQQLYQQFPEYNFVGRVLTEAYYVRSEERTRSLRMQTSLERYNALLHSQPRVFQRAPLKHIASYLGMSAETLSRLRAKVK